MGEGDEKTWRQVAIMEMVKKKNWILVAIMEMGMKKLEF